MPRSELNQPSVILPIIRNVIPDIIAAEICNVQPIPAANMINPFSKKWERIGKYMPTDDWVYNVRSSEIQVWVEEQPIHMWKFYEATDSLDLPLSALIGENYIFSEEMEAWFQLRWS